ncbi:ABC transporter ATP-binding protein [Marinomonas mediterranea]|uniref:ABC transporter ATP-binding protein n=1 Tax=Marinomonas mediterranea TaxID=119864 RepID=UPI00234BEFE8|nr:ABC transporter ATP-binding protein [Marinomonas mediterranea]WCN08147.1 ATP-binding cassette domain-containing protein [Marinomonas mediterranea]WCN12216.1 ATP-binding cassette domain-containing protein [Marinomonas mediterranea]
MSRILEVNNLQVDLPTANGTLRAVRGIDLSVNKGEMLCIVGESGCGKSMTSMALMGLLPKKAKVSADKMDFDGLDLLSLTTKKRNRVRGLRMSMIFQEPMTSLNPSYTLGNQLCEGIMRHKGVSKTEAQKRAIYLLERAGVPYPEKRLSQYPHQLSGGLRQRVMIAMALMCEPDLIIADEPTTALDVTIQAQILRLIRELQQEFGTAVIFITHDLGVVARIADRVAVMYAGQVVETGSTNDIFTHPSHPYTQGLLSCIPIPGKTPPGSHLESIPGVVPSLVGNLTGCVFRNRCQHSSKECASSAPELITVCEQTSHQARCPVLAETYQEAV